MSVSVGNLLYSRRTAIENAIAVSNSLLNSILGAIRDISNNIRINDPPDIHLSHYTGEVPLRTGINLSTSKEDSYNDESNIPVGEVTDFSGIITSLTEIFQDISIELDEGNFQLKDPPRVNIQDYDIDVSAHFQNIEKPGDAPAFQAFSVPFMNNFNVIPPEKLVPPDIHLPEISDDELDIIRRIQPDTSPYRIPIPSMPSEINGADLLYPDIDDGTLPVYGKVQNALRRNIEDTISRAEEVSSSTEYMKNALQAVRAHSENKILKPLSDYTLSVHLASLKGKATELEQEVSVFREYIENLLRAENITIDLTAQYCRIIADRYGLRFLRLRWAIEYYDALYELYSIYYRVYNSYLQLFETAREEGRNHIRRAENKLRQFGTMLEAYRAEIQSYASKIEADMSKIRMVDAKIDAYERYVRSQQSMIGILSSVNRLNQSIKNAYEATLNSKDIEVYNRISRLRLLSLLADILSDKSHIKRRFNVAMRELKAEKNRLKEIYRRLTGEPYRIQSMLEELKTVKLDAILERHKMNLRLIEEQNNTNIRTMRESIDRNIRMLEETVNTAYRIGENASGVVGRYLAGMATSLTASAVGIYEALLWQ